MTLQLLVAAEAEGLEDGSVDASGIGRRDLNPAKGPMSLVFILEQVLGAVERKHQVVLELLDADRQLVTPAGMLAPLRVGFELVIPKPDDHVAGEPLRKTVTMRLDQMSLPAGAYLWRASSGDDVAEWQFVVAPS